MTEKCGLIFTNAEQGSLVIAGLSLQERMIRTLKKAGVTNIFLLTSQNEEAIRNLTEHQTPVLCLAGTTLVDYHLVEELCASPPDEGEAVLCVVRAEEPSASSSSPTVSLPLLLCSSTLTPRLVEALQQGAKTFDAVLTYLKDRIQIHPRLIQGKFWYLITGAESIREAEEGLLTSLVKETDSPVAKMLDRRISLRVSRLLMHTEITPNQITLICLLIGLGGAFLLTIPHQIAMVAGAILFLISTTLDGCDGEIARLKFLESRYGGWLDLLCDNVIHIALFLGIAVGLYRQDQKVLYLILGGLATIGVIASVSAVCYVTLRRKGGTGPFFTSVVDEQKAQNLSPRLRFLVKVNDLLARRDFSYLLVLLALVKKLEWFLWGGAIGANLFFLSLLGIYNWGESSR